MTWLTSLLHNVVKKCSHLPDQILKQLAMNAEVDALVNRLEFECTPNRQHWHSHSSMHALNYLQRPSNGGLQSHCQQVNSFWFHEISVIF